MEQSIFSGIRLAGDEISSEEWIDPLEKAEDLPTPVRREMPKAINLAEAAGLGDDHGRTVYSITIPESEFMHFNIENDGSPATIVALFLCRAIAKMYPDAEDARIALRAGSEAVLHGICTGITLMAGKRSLR